MEPRAPSKEASLTSHVSLLMVAKTLGFAFSMALPLILVRRMNQAEYGLYKQVFLVLATALYILPFGFGMNAYYFLPREPEHRRQTVANIMVFNFVVGGLAFLALFFCPVLLQWIFRDTKLAGFSPLIGVMILLWIFGAFLEIVPIAHGEVGLATIFIICVQLTRTVLFVTAAVWMGTVRSLIYAAIIQGAFQSCFLLVYLHSRFRGFWRCFDWKMLRRQLSYSVPLGMGAALFTLQTDLHNYVVSNRFGASEYAIYSVGTFNLPLVGLLQEAANAVLIPRVGLMQQREQHQEVIYLIARAMRKLAAVYFPIYALMMVVGPQFIEFLFTKRYRASWPIFAVNLTLILTGILMQDPLFRAYISERFFLLRFRFAVLAVLIVALWIGTSRYGPMGAICAVVIVNFMERTITALRFGRLIGVGRKDLVLLRDVAKIAIAAAASGAAAALLRLLLSGYRPIVILLACGTIFALVYAGALLLLKVPTAEEKELVREKIAMVLKRPARSGAAS
ncbi:MAG: oligosaccharide flippase family protein [Bryobacteraceae bacterium]